MDKIIAAAFIAGHQYLGIIADVAVAGPRRTGRMARNCIESRGRRSNDVSAQRTLAPFMPIPYSESAYDHCGRCQTPGRKLQKSALLPGLVLKPKLLQYSRFHASRHALYPAALR